MLLGCKDASACCWHIKEASKQAPNQPLTSFARRPHCRPVSVGCYHGPRRRWRLQRRWRHCVTGGEVRRRQLHRVLRLRGLLQQQSALRQRRQRAAAATGVRQHHLHAVHTAKPGPGRLPGWGGGGGGGGGGGVLSLFLACFLSFFVSFFLIYTFIWPSKTCWFSVCGQ